MQSAHSSDTARGYLMIMLHAHLPYIRYPEHENFLEENWLYETMTETYIPLINILENLVDDNVDFRLSLSLSPPLIEMLSDDLLMSRYERYLCRLIELSEREIYRNRKNIRVRDLANMYHKRFLRTRHLFENVYRRDLISAFRELMESGRLEIATSSATHAYLPALMTEPAAVKVQIQLAVAALRWTVSLRKRALDIFFLNLMVCSTAPLEAEKISIRLSRRLQASQYSPGMPHRPGRYGARRKGIQVMLITGIFTAISALTWTWIMSDPICLTASGHSLA
jgi:hypothetical protein